MARLRTFAPRDRGRSPSPARTVAAATTRAPAPASTSFELLASAGNRAVTRLVQDATAEDGRSPVVSRMMTDVEPHAATVTQRVLDAQALTAAHQFYAARPAVYTPAIVELLRAELALSPGDVLDDGLILAVAEWQARQTSGPPLTVDGCAGPRTLARMFPSGLTSGLEPLTYALEAQDEVVGEWALLGEFGEVAEEFREHPLGAHAAAWERLTALATVVNRALDAAGVPAIGFTLLDRSGEGVMGEFDARTWQMAVDVAALSSPVVVDPGADQTLVEIVYHEARHAEQWFRIAQLYAARGLAAPDLVSSLGIPLAVAEAAASAAPMDLTSVDAVVAQGWADSAADAQRDAVHREIREAGSAFRAEREAHRSSGGPTTGVEPESLTRARERWLRAFAAYQHLPEEDDAFVAQSHVRLAMMVMPAPAVTDAVMTPDGTGMDVSAVDLALDHDATGLLGGRTAPVAPWPDLEEVDMDLDPDGIDTPDLIREFLAELGHAVAPADRHG